MTENNNFALIAMVAIVAVVGMVGLILNMSGNHYNSVAIPNSMSDNSGNTAGQVMSRAISGGHECSSNNDCNDLGGGECHNGMCDYRYQQ